MGLLDDAIREHLELKRRRGEDAAEIARLEHDAFGPIRGRDDNGEDAEEHAPQAAAHESPVATEPESAHEPLADDGPPAEDETRVVVEHDPIAEPDLEPESPRIRATAEPLAPVPEPEPLPPDPEPLPPEPAPLPEPTPLPGEEPPAEEPGPLPDAPEPLAGDDPQATVAFSLDEDEAVGTPDATDEPPDPDTVAADEEHDELEETPEFLQETPEHDRLWFEQKPPRDFDF